MRFKFFLQFPQKITKFANGDRTAEAPVTGDEAVGRQLQAVETAAAIK